jgi:proline racemase
LLGIALEVGDAQALAQLGVKITNAANAQLTFNHPTQAEWRHHSFCLFAGPLERDTVGLRAKSVVSDMVILGNLQQPYLSILLNNNS